MSPWQHRMATGALAQCEMHQGEEQEIDSSHRSRTIARNTVAVAVAVAIAIARGLWHSYRTAAASARCGRFET